MRGPCFFKSSKNIVSQSQRSNVYRVLAEIHIRYADVIVGCVSNSKMESLQRFQDRSSSIIDTARIKDDWSKNFLQVTQLITFDRSVMTYKIMKRLCSFYENLQVPKYKVEYSKNRFSYTALKAWNEIPMNIR